MRKLAVVSLAVGVTLAAVAGVCRVLAVYWTDGAGPAPAIAQVPSIVMRDANLSLRGRNGRSWQVRAPHVSMSADHGQVELTGPASGEYVHGKRTLLHFVAGKVQADMVQHRLEITDQVTVYGPHGLRIQAAGLRSAAGGRKLMCPGPVRVKMRRGWATGQDLEADTDLRHVVIHHLHLAAELGGSGTAR